MEVDPENDTVAISLYKDKRQESAPSIDLLVDQELALQSWRSSTNLINLLTRKSGASAIISENGHPRSIGGNDD